MVYSATWYFTLANHYRKIMQAPCSAAANPPLWIPLEQPPQGSPHADATANPAGSRFTDRTGAVRSLDTPGSAAPRPHPAPGEGLEDPGTGRIRLLLLSVVLPALALGRHAGLVPALQPGIAAPLRRGRHRRAGL